MEQRIRKITSIHLPHISQEKEEGLLTLFHTSVLKFNLLA